jgi:hypothetical protein
LLYVRFVSFDSTEVDNNSRSNRERNKDTYIYVYI